MPRARHFDLTEFWQQLDGPGWPPEYSLVVAVLKRAALDYLDHRLPLRVRLDAGDWIFASETGPWSCWWAFETVFDEPQPHYDRFAALMKAHPDAPAPPVGGKSLTRARNR